MVAGSSPNLSPSWSPGCRHRRHPNAHLYRLYLHAVSAFLLAPVFRLGRRCPASGRLLRHAGRQPCATDQSARSAFIDSTLDRYSESITFLALAYHYMWAPGSRTELVLIFIILIGSLMVSYNRRRGLEHRVQGRHTQRRTDNLLVIGLLIGGLLPILWILAIFTNITAIQRIYEFTGGLYPPQTSSTEDRQPGDNRPCGTGRSRLVPARPFIGGFMPTISGARHRLKTNALLPSNAVRPQCGAQT